MKEEENFSQFEKTLVQLITHLEATQSCSIRYLCIDQIRCTPCWMHYFITCKYTTHRIGETES